MCRFANSTTTRTLRTYSTTPRTPPNRPGASVFRDVLGSFQIRASAAKVAGMSVGAVITLCTLPIITWPLVDQFLFPKVIEWAITSVGPDAKETSRLNVREASKMLEELLRNDDGHIIVLTGEHAGALGRTFARTHDKCGLIDYRRVYDQNPYELAATDHIGFLGKIITVYMKGGIFITNIMGKRHPHVDAIMILHNLNNNYQKALRTLKQNTGVRPTVIFANVDAHMHSTSTDLTCGESKNLNNHMHVNISQVSLSWGRDNAIARVVWLCENAGWEELKKRRGEISDAARYAHVYVVEVNDNVVELHRMNE